MLRTKWCCNQQCKLYTFPDDNLHMYNTGRHINRDKHQNSASDEATDAR